MIRQELLRRVPEPPQDEEIRAGRLRTKLRGSLHHTRRTLSHTGEVAVQFWKEHKITTILIPSAAVVAVGATEGALYCHDPKFILAYGLAKLGSGPIWVRDAAENVAAVTGVDLHQINN